jgi:hypothetical protein
MAQSNQRLAQLLVYSGAIPFIACVCVSVLGWDIFDARWYGITYGAVILSFLAGIHWGVYLFLSPSCPYNLFITSNIAALLGWLSLLIFPHWGSSLLLILCFSWLLLIDHKLFKLDIIPDWFYRLRVHATIIVIVSLLSLALINWPAA